MRTIFTPTYKNPEYKFIPLPVGHVLPHSFDEEAIYYDIKQRNNIVLKNNDDDDDFDFRNFKF